MVTIQILSDLHLEVPKAYDLFEIVHKAPYLALLGDIGVVIGHKEDFLAFLDRQLKLFKAVLFVPGNHEAYGSSWGETLQALRGYEQSVRGRRAVDDEGEFVLLDRGIFEPPAADGGEKIAILGCSLFSHVPIERAMEVEMRLNDFYKTTPWDVRAHNEAHARDLAWLNEQVGKIQAREDGTKIAILTHWSPTTDSRATDPRHIDSPIGSAFATDLSDQICFSNDEVVLWAFGHTHYNCDFMAERENSRALRVATNQRGYYFAQAEGFDGEKVVEL